MRKRRSRHDWLHHIEEQKRSGLSAKEYCAREGISCWSFYTKRARLSKTVPSPKKVSITPSTTFVNLGALQSHKHQSTLTISFSNGTSLDFHGQQSNEQLVCILDTLQRSTRGDH